VLEPNGNKTDEISISSVCWYKMSWNIHVTIVILMTTLRSSSVQTYSITSHYGQYHPILMVYQTHRVRQAPVESSTRRVQKKPNVCYKNFILQHFKHCPLQTSPLYRRHTVPNVSSIVGMLPGTHFL